MSGTLPGLSLTQQFGSNGRLLVSGKLYFYAANTSTPQNAYQDVALTIAHPRPIVLNEKARVPAFYLADGSVRARLEDKNGVAQFDEAALLVIGPSSGDGGGGSGVDPNAIFQTGDPMWVPINSTRDGWVRMNGRTIGSTTSGATERANSDTQALFLYNWTNFPDSMCPVGGGRGATAAADWAANKVIATRDMRGTGPFGLADMGNTDSGVFTGLTFGVGDKSTGGSQLGGATLTLAAGQIPQVTGSATATSTFTGTAGTQAITAGGGAISLGGGGSINLVAVSGAVATTISALVAGSASPTAVDKMPRAILGSWYQRL